MEDKIRVFVLAGGKGERLFPFSSVIPKCLVPVAGKPCIRWIVEDAIRQGFNDIVLCLNKKDESFFNAFYSINGALAFMLEARAELGKDFLT